MVNDPRLGREEVLRVFRNLLRENRLSITALIARKKKCKWRKETADVPPSEVGKGSMFNQTNIAD